MENLTIHNAIELGEDISLEAKGKGRYFQSRFIEAGLAHYEQFGDVLITKETLDKFIFSMVGCPVIIKHKDITEENADKERVGVVSKVWYNELDGWYWCEGIIWDKQAIDLVKNQGWSVSCTYDFESDFKKGTYHGKDYDMEFTGGEFLHLALVPNPRYERANIVVNSKDNEKGKWVTIKGTHVFIPEGKQIEEVMKEKGWPSERKQSDKKDSSKDNLKGKYSKEDAEFDEEQVKKDIAAAKEKGYESIEEISEYLGLDEDETRTFVEEKEQSATFDDEAFEKFKKEKRESDKKEDDKELSPKEIKKSFHDIIDKNVQDIVPEIMAYYASRSRWGDETVEDIRKGKYYKDLQERYKSVDDFPKSFANKVRGLWKEMDSNDIKEMEKNPQAFRDYIGEFGSYLFASKSSFEDWMSREFLRTYKAKNSKEQIVDIFCEALAEVVIENCLGE